MQIRHNPSSGKSVKHGTGRKTSGSKPVRTVPQDAGAPPPEAPIADAGTDAVTRQTLQIAAVPAAGRELQTDSDPVREARQALIDASQESAPDKLAGHVRDLIKLMIQHPYKSSEEEINDAINAFKKTRGKPKSPAKPVDNYSQVIQAFERNPVCKPYMNKIRFIQYETVIWKNYDRNSEQSRTNNTDTLTKLMGHHFSIDDTAIKTTGWNSGMSFKHMRDALILFQNYLQWSGYSASDNTLIQAVLSKCSDFENTGILTSASLEERLNALKSHVVQLSPGQSLVVPISVTDGHHSHSVVHEFRKNADNTFSWQMFNAGLGVSRHAGTGQEGKVNAIKETTGYTIHEMGRILEKIVKFSDSKYKPALLNKLTSSVTGNRVDQLYQLQRKKSTVPHPDFQHAAQKTGVCSWKSLKAWVHFNTLGNEPAPPSSQLYKEFSSFLDLAIFVTSIQNPLSGGNAGEEKALQALQARVEDKFTQRLARVFAGAGGA